MAYQPAVAKVNNSNGENIMSAGHRNVSAMCNVAIEIMWLWLKLRHFCEKCSSANHMQLYLCVAWLGFRPGLMQWLINLCSWRLAQYRENQWPSRHVWPVCRNTNAWL